MERRSVGVLGREQETLTLHKMCMSPHLYPLPARCTGLACTGAGRGQGEGQVPLKMKDHRATEKPLSLSSQRGMVHASHAFYATIRFTPRSGGVLWMVGTSPRRFVVRTPRAFSISG